LNAHDLLQLLANALLAWIALELRSLRALVHSHGERLAVVETRMSPASRTDSLFALFLIGITATLGACAAAGSSALGAVGGAAIGGPPGAAAGALGGLIGSCWTSIVSALQHAFDWIGWGSKPAAPPTGGIGWGAVVLGLAALYVLWRSLTARSVIHDLGAAGGLAKRALARLRRRT
jgi:hypothetical protein